MEYFRHLVAAESQDVSLAGFLKLNGDETDALVMTLFLRDLSAEHGIRTVLRDEDHPLTKLRYLEFRAGKLPSGNSLEEMLARRPVIKKVDGQAIMFYPPSYRLHSQAPPGQTRWGYSLYGLRASLGVRPGPVARTSASRSGEPVSWSRAQTTSWSLDSFVTRTVSTTANANCEAYCPLVRT